MAFRMCSLSSVRGQWRVVAATCGIQVNSNILATQGQGIFTDLALASLRVWWHFMWSTVVVAYYLKYFSVAWAFPTDKEPWYSVSLPRVLWLRNWALFLCENSREKKEGRKEGRKEGKKVVNSTLELIWINHCWKVCFSSHAFFLKLRGLATLSGWRPWRPLWGPPSSLGSGAKSQVGQTPQPWCNESFYLTLVCHSHKWSIMGAGLDWCPLQE